MALFSPMVNCVAPHGTRLPAVAAVAGEAARLSAPSTMKSSAALVVPPSPDSNTGDVGGCGVHCCSGKAICPICYEDLKPIVEHLQAVSVCGHVFHELCLQQWLEYCPAGKGCTCPVCKQSCTAGGVTRLYFQSTGSAEPSQQFPAQKALSEAEAEALCGEISKLQGKLSAVGFALDAQKLHVDELNNEILVWKEKAKREEEMKNEHRKEKELARRLLQMKEADLSKTSEERSKLQERSLVLAKELAALKLAMDVNLGEEEIAKLASIGHGTKHTDAIDVLQKSLFLRNKAEQKLDAHLSDENFISGEHLLERAGISYNVDTRLANSKTDLLMNYKELMAQCNLLGRAETRSLKKLEKAEEKIKKLKKQLQELEKAFEKKDTEILRNMKVSKGKRDRRADFSCFKQMPDSLHTGGCPLEVHPGNAVKELVDSNQISSALPDKNVHLPSVSVLRSSANTWMDPSLLKTSVFGAEGSSSQLIDAYEQTNLGDVSSSPRVCITKDEGNDLDNIMDENMLNIINPASAKETMVVDDNFGLAPLIPVMELSSVNDSNVCFGDPLLPTSLTGPANANRYPGKWCKRLQTKVTSTVQMSSGSGSLIAVGADGRGGRVKVLRPHEKSETKAQSLWPKKCKYGTTQGGQTRGCLRIEQFFGKIEN